MQSRKYEAKRKEKKKKISKYHGISYYKQIIAVVTARKIRLVGVLSNIPNSLAVQLSFTPKAKGQGQI